MALAAAPPEVACVQAKLAFFNPTQNLITKWFTIEYRMWFTQFLPGLAQLDAPIPLGGTSNHFRREVLLELNAWDPFNVTEDADLGVRLRRAGYRSAVRRLGDSRGGQQRLRQLDQAAIPLVQGLCSDPPGPPAPPPDTLSGAWRRGVARCSSSSSAGRPLLALLNPIFWILTSLWWVAHPAFIRDLFPTGVYFAGLDLLGGRKLRLRVHLHAERAGPSKSQAVDGGGPHARVLGDDVDGGGQGGHPARQCTLVLGEDRRDRRDRGRAGRASQQASTS